MNTYKYKVHSAIYSCSNDSSSVKSAYDVTEKAQYMLSDTARDGILDLNKIINSECVNTTKKSFAIIVTVVYPDDKILTRFCTCEHGTNIDIKESGIVCSI